ncbi:MAG: tRNA (N6-isopentenyl adenosine(37)-C2)-methylthiotransferase MiaB [Chloroflexi bacterium]|nr:tRNA (N6-isopentenyl adenosine(37)-C2)-methylthiotransferase MiaB [Chloroflexota bacterium]
MPTITQKIAARYYIWTIGCQMNRAESERLSSLLEQQGYQATDSPEDADIILVNSCVVRQHAEDRVFDKINAFKPFKKARPGITIAVTGCLVDSNIAEMKRDFPHIDHFFKAGDVPSWLGEAGWCQILPQRPSVSVYVPVIQGCDQFCSYCIVPYRRGRERSRPLQEIGTEVRELVSRGAKEVILLGQNVDAYGHDLPGRPDLADLLEALNDIDGLSRIRFLTNHPKDMNTKLIEAIARLGKVCEQVNLPVQSGSNDILKAMRRGYTVEHYRDLIAKMRNKALGISLSTDIIVGFPSESEEQFQQTVSLLAELRFDTVHVAAYSPRPGTIAAREMKDDIPAQEKKRRLRVIEALQEGIAAEINARLLGQTVEVLVEGEEKGKWRGRTRSDKLVFFASDGDYSGRLVNILVERTSPWSLQGKLD